jgi:hypothetical protein
MPILALRHMIVFSLGLVSALCRLLRVGVCCNLTCVPMKENRAFLTSKQPHGTPWPSRSLLEDHLTCFRNQRYHLSSDIELSTIGIHSNSMLTHYAAMPYRCYKSTGAFTSRLLCEAPFTALLWRHRSILRARCLPT